MQTHRDRKHIHVARSCRKRGGGGEGLLNRNCVLFGAMECSGINQVVVMVAGLC